MTEFKKVFVDTAPFIYFIEKDINNPQYFEKMKSFFSYCYNKKLPLVTSVITFEEYMVYPYKNNRFDYIDSFERLINILEFDVINIDKSVAKEAAKIRAKYTAFKGMDTLQLAAANKTECDLFITNDRQLIQFKEIKCLSLDELDI